MHCWCLPVRARACALTHSHGPMCGVGVGVCGVGVCGVGVCGGMRRRGSASSVTRPIAEGYKLSSPMETGIRAPTVCNEQTP
jgi:hypothetical protein